MQDPRLVVGTRVWNRAHSVRVAVEKLFLHNRRVRIRITMKIRVKTGVKIGVKIRVRKLCYYED